MHTDKSANVAIRFCGRLASARFGCKQHVENLYELPPNITKFQENSWSGGRWKSGTWNGMEHHECSMYHSFHIVPCVITNNETNGFDYDSLSELYLGLTKQQMLLVHTKKRITAIDNVTNTSHVLRLRISLQLLMTFKISQSSMFTNKSFNKWALLQELLGRDQEEDSNDWWRWSNDNKHWTGRSMEESQTVVQERDHWCLVVLTSVAPET